MKHKPKYYFFSFFVVLTFANITVKAKSHPYFKHFYKHKRNTTINMNI